MEKKARGRREEGRWKGTSSSWEKREDKPQGRQKKAPPCKAAGRGKVRQGLLKEDEKKS